MEAKKRLNSFDKEGDSKFAIRKGNIVNGQSNINHDVGNEITYNIEVLKSHLCDKKDAYVLLIGIITIAEGITSQD